MRSGVVVQHLGTPLDDGIVLRPGVALDHGEGGVARFFARDGFERPTPGERAAIVAASRVAVPDAVTVMRCEPALREWFWENALARVCAPEAEISTEERRSCLWEFGRLVADSVASAGVRVEAIRSCDVQITPANARSTSFDYRERRYVGLHVDDHDRLGAHERRTAFQVFCLNVGHADRYLHFVNVAVPGMIESLGGSSAIPAGTPIRHVVAEFFRSFPDYPVVRVTLPPDYAYVAVTQYIVHDGLPNSAGEADVAFLMAGWFSLPDVIRDA